MKAINRFAVLSLAATIAMAIQAGSAKAQTVDLMAPTNSLMAPTNSMLSPDSPAPTPMADLGEPWIGDMGYNGNTMWTVNVAGLLLTRSTPLHANLVTQLRPLDTLLSARSLDCGFAIGPRIDVNGDFGGLDVGFVYYGIDSWGFTREYADPNNLGVPPLSWQSPFSWAKVDYNSKLYNIEANAKTHVFGRYHVLGGFRWTEIAENAWLMGAGTSFSGATGMHTTNDLFGFQIGMEGPLFDQGGPFHLDSFVKAGIFVNDLRNTAGAYGDATPVAVQAYQSHTAFVGEVGLTANYQITTNFGVFGGLECLWIDGISLAPEMLTGKTAFTTTSLYWGGMTGITVTW